MAGSQGSTRWRRTLRFGMKGRDVALLQEELSRLGYYTCDIDGVFGILTKEAVRELQKAHRLRVDGIAGKEVFAVIGSGLAKPVLRHCVARGETCAHIARRYNIPIELLLHANRLRDAQVHEGQRLDIPVSRLLAYFAGGDAAERSWGSYERHLAFISTVAPRWFTLEADGAVAGEPAKRVVALASLADIRVVPVVAPGRRRPPATGDCDQPKRGDRGSGADRGVAGDDGSPSPQDDEAGDSALDAVLMDAAARRAAIKGITAAAVRSRAHGIILSVAAAPGPADAYALTSFVRELASVLERDKRDLTLEIPAPRIAAGDNGKEAGAGGSFLEYEELARVTRNLIVRLHEEPEQLAMPGPPASPALARAVIKHMTRVIPPWKMILGIPLFGVDFSAAPGAPAMRRAHFETKDILDIYKPSVVRVEAGGACMFRYRSFRVNHTVFFTDAAAAGSYADLAIKFNLAGLAVADLGDEDPLVWDAFRTKFKALRESVLPA
ncbi:MAG: peptidoglycan-binding protein [Betaproteobacteria bacterium]